MVAVDGTEVIALLAAVLAAFEAGRRSRRPAHVARGAARAALGVGTVTAGAVGRVAGLTSGTVAGMARRGGDAGRLGADATRGALAGAGFGFVQFRAARHLRRHATHAPQPVERVSTDASLTASSAGGAPFVLVGDGPRFHRPGCGYATPGLREVTREVALAEGRVACRACTP